MSPSVDWLLPFLDGLVPQPAQGRAVLLGRLRRRRERKRVSYLSYKGRQLHGRFKYFRPGERPPGEFAAPVSLPTDKFIGRYLPSALRQGDDIAAHPQPQNQAGGQVDRKMHAGNDPVYRDPSSEPCEMDIPVGIG